MTLPHSFDRFVAALLAIVATAHVALVFGVPRLEEKFQLGDRAWDRTAKIDAIMAARDWNGVLEAVFYHSSPGDYVFFLPAYAVFGAPGVIAQNIVLLLVGVYFLYRIGREFFSPAIAKIATITYCLLPSTLFHPQSFATESLCNPLLIVASYLALRMLRADRPALRDIAAFAVLCAVICFSRHIYVLFPLVAAGLLLVRAQHPRIASIRSASMVVVALSLVGLWQSALWANDGRYEVAPSFHGLSSNLFLRAERMAGMGGFALPPEALDTRSTSPSEFITLTRRHPGSFARSVLSDAINMVANTGVTMAYGRYLGMFDLEEGRDADTFKWRNVRDSHGTLAMVKLLWRTSPAGLIVNLMAAIVWAAILLLALYGFLAYLRARTHHVAIRMFFAALPCYVFVFSFVAGSVRWDHRSPMEFVICLFFAYGAVRLLQIARGAHAAPYAQSQNTAARA